MKYTILGRAGIKVSRISMGTHHLDNPSDIDKHVSNILYAYEKGVNFFESGATYGDGNSEVILGEAIKEMKKDRIPFYIMSKTHFGDHKTFRKDLESSLSRLGIDCIDSFTCLWGVKSIGEWIGARKFGVLEEMERAREEGLIRHISISAHLNSKEMQQLMQDYPFDICELGVNVLNSVYKMDGLKAAWKNGAGILAMNPLATGDLLRFPDIFRAVRMREEQSLVQAAYTYSLSLPWVHSVLGTFNSPSQIDEALSALEAPLYSESELSAVQKKLRAHIAECPYEKRLQAGRQLRSRPAVLREEAADLMQVYPLSI
jgi:predicted aldo/keto reductase-like oxidoreductase